MGWLDLGTRIDPAAPPPPPHRTGPPPHRPPPPPPPSSPQPARAPALRRRRPAALGVRRRGALNLHCVQRARRGGLRVHAPHAQRNHAGRRRCRGHVARHHRRQQQQNQRQQQWRQRRPGHGPRRAGRVSPLRLPRCNECKRTSSVVPRVPPHRSSAPVPRLPGPARLPVARGAGNQPRVATRPARGGAATNTGRADRHRLCRRRP